MNTLQFSSFAGTLGLSIGMGLTTASCGGDQFTATPEGHSYATMGAGGGVGSAGVAGASGHAGDAGQSGQSGHGGLGGQSGSAGAGGFAGSGGAAGIAGKAGFAGSATGGASGKSGNSGAGGTAGMAGKAGMAGIAGMAGSGGLSGLGGVSGMGGSGGMTIDPASPQPAMPAASQILVPSRAFLSWKDGTIPSGKMVSGYDVCWTTGAMTTINDVTQCPNKSSPTKSHTVLKPLTKDSTYLWKVRGTFSDGSVSQWSAVQAFATDHPLAAWLPMDEGMGTMTADASGSGNNGTLQNGPVWTPGMLGQSLQFDGMTTRYVSLNDAPSLNFGTGDFSLGAWIRSHATGANQAIIDKRVIGNGYILYKNTSGQLAFWDEVGTSTTGGTLTDGVWNYVVATRSATTINLYINGAMVATGTSSVNVMNPSLLTIGSDTMAHAYAQEFNGEIDEVMITSGAATQASILNNFCAVQDLAGVDPLPASCLP